MSNVLDLLMVEDDPVLQKIQSAVIQSMGHNVFVADSGKEALEMLAHYRFDGVLLDLNMPEMDGFATFSALQRLNLATPIVALTGDDDDETRLRCLQLGMNGFVNKPLTVAKISEFLHYF